MAVTKQQKTAFQDYIKTNNIDASKLTNADASEFLQTWSIGAINPTTPQVTTTFGWWEVKPFTWTAESQRMDTVIPTETPKTEQPQVETSFWGWEVRQVWVNAPIQEKTTTITPEWTTQVIKEQPKDTTITKDTKWQDTDKSMNTLEQMVEARYGTVATQKDGKIRATIWDKTYEWVINPQTWLPEKSEVQLTQAEITRNNLLSKYQTANPDVIYNALINGDISPEMEQNLVNNPNFAIAKERQRKQQSVNNTNSAVQGMYDTLTWKQTEEQDIVQNLSDRIVNGKIASWKTESELADYSTFLWEDVELKSTVTELNGKIQLKRELERTIKDRMDDIIKQYPWMTKGAAMVLSARDNKDLYNQLDYINDDILTLQSTVAYREKILDKEYDTRLKEQQLQEQRAYQEWLTAEERAYQEWLQTRQLEQQYAYQYGDLNSDNPTLQSIAIERAVADLYEKYPIPGMESQATKVQKVRDLMAQWMTWSEAIAQLEQEIRSTQRYKSYISGITPLQQAQLDLDRAKLGWTTTTTSSWLSVTPWTTQNRPDRNNNPWNLKMWDVWFGVDDQNHTIFWDAASWYQALVNDITAKMTWNTRTWLWPESTLAELGKVYAEDPNWANAVSRLSGYSLTTKLKDMDVNKLAPAIAKQEWFTWSISAWITWRQYTDNDIALLAAVTKLDKQGRETLRENGFTEQDWANFNAWLLPPTTSQKEEAGKVITLVDKLAKHPWLNNAVWYKWPIWTFTTIAGTDKADFEALFNTLVDSLAASNLDKIKGAMSDKDIEFLRNIEKNWLNYDSSEKQFKEQLNELKQRYEKVMTRGGGQIAPTTGTTQTIWTITSASWNTYTY